MFKSIAVAAIVAVAAITAEPALAQTTTTGSVGWRSTRPGRRQRNDGANGSG